MSNEKTPAPVTVGEVLTAEVPPQPSNRTIGMDRFEIAWQRSGHRWYRAGFPIFDFLPSPAKGPDLAWPDLVVHRGPITLLHVPTGEDA